MRKTRKFNTGATRDNNTDKPNYAGFFSPLVIKRFGEYMMKHQVLPDGSKRNADNWKQLFGDNHATVCFESNLRHVIDLWLIHDDMASLSRDEHQDVLCAMMFNTMAELYKILKDKHEEPEKLFSLSVFHKIVRFLKCGRIKNKKGK